jgi:hypothetical protein
MNMNLFNILLIIHVIGGTLGLLAGSYIMIAKKGDKNHQRIGKVFAINMLGAGISSLALAMMHRNDFLFAVGVFTIYLAGTGWRYLFLKNLSNGQKPTWMDWFLMLFMSLASILFLVMAAQNLLDKNYFGIIILLFAWRGITFVIQDYKTYNGIITTKNYWLIYHLQRMTGAYIASLSAFLVLNAPNAFSFVPWILPTIILVPLIIKWTRKYQVLKD